MAAPQRVRREAGRCPECNQAGTVEITRTFTRHGWGIGHVTAITCFTEGCPHYHPTPQPEPPRIVDAIEELGSSTEGAPRSTDTPDTVKR